MFTDRAPLGITAGNERLLPNPETNVSRSKQIPLFLDQRCSSVGLLVDYPLEWVTSWSSCQVQFPTGVEELELKQKLASWFLKAFTRWGCWVLRPVRIGSQYCHDEDYKEDAQCEPRAFLTHKVPLEGRYAHWRCSTLQAKAQFGLLQFSISVGIFGREWCLLWLLLWGFTWPRLL